ncbi:MAG: ComEA family DNA-binding protein [Oscillospiraceae bacterium]
MKLRRFEVAVIVVTLVFASFTAGYFTGRSSIDSVVTVGVQSDTNSGKTDTVNTDMGKTNSETSVTSAETETAAEKPDSGIEGADEKLNLNTADVSQLELLPSIGEVLAQRIVDYREKNGGFRAVEELLNVSGIGQQRYESIKDLVEVG